MQKEDNDDVLCNALKWQTDSRAHYHLYRKRISMSDTKKLSVISFSHWWGKKIIKTAVILLTSTVVF